MSNPDVQKSAVNTMIMVNAAIRNLRLYPATSTSTSNAIDKAYQSILDTLQIVDALVFSEFERSLIVCEQPLSEKEQKKPQVQAFLDIMLNFGIKNLTFRPGIDREEFTNILEIISEKPEDIRTKGGIEKVALGKKFSHIDLACLTSEQGGGGIGRGGAGGGPGGVIVKEALLPMIHMLDDVLDSENKKKIAGHLANSIITGDDDITVYMLTQSIEREFSQMVFDHILAEMNDDKFETILDRIQKRYDPNKSENEENDSLKQAIENLMNSDKGKRLQIRIQERLAQEKADKEKKQAKLKACLNDILKGDTQPLSDPEILEALPGTIEGFFEKDKAKTGETLIDKLGDALKKGQPEEQNGAAEVIEKIGEYLFSHERSDIIVTLSHKLADWLKRQTQVSTSAEKIIRQLQQIAQPMIKEKRFSECRHILDTLNQMGYGKFQQDDNVQTLAAEALKVIITDEITEPLIKEFRTNEANQRKEAGQQLTELGAPAAERLLAVLKESEDQYERRRLLQVIGDIGPAALPALKTQIASGEPWYYMRNLVLLFGKVGNETHLEIIKPFLHHKDIRVKRETIGCIFAIGGERREEIFLESLHAVDDQIKIDVVNMLGALESERAAPMLIEMIESKKAKDDLAEKICTALGNIGSHEAIPVLSEIMEQKKKGLLGGKPYGDKVKTAASNAMAAISKGKPKPKQTQKGKESIFPALYQALSPDEAKVLNDAFQTATFHSDHALFTQGQINDTLYGIQNGRVKLFYPQSGRENLIKTLTTGDMFGEDTMFRLTLCTCSAVTLADTNTLCIKKDTLSNWQDTLPALFNKLKDYCKGQEKIPEVLKKNGLDRRAFKRSNLKGNTAIQILNASGKPAGKPIQGSIIDISKGGISFGIKIPESSARQLLNRNLTIKFALPAAGGNRKIIETNGTIVSLCDDPSGIFSVHVKFEKDL